jgi:hypothetical protein
LPLAVIAILSLAGCNAGSERSTDIQVATDTAATNIARVTEVVQQLSLADTAIPNPSPTIQQPTATQEPTIMPEPTQIPPVVRVSENTNCRSGPDRTFAFLGVLSVGEQADVVAKSGEGDYWYITNPDDPKGFCWLWGEYATIEGEMDALPVVTPAPTPTPYVGFDVWFHGFEPCGGHQTAIFKIRNGGAVRLWSGWVAVYAMDPLDDLYGPARERHPFADNPLPACPPGHGNELYPGEVRYIHAPLDSHAHGRNAYAEITLCSADHGGGDCVTKIGYFYIP